MITKETNRIQLQSTGTKKGFDDKDRLIKMRKQNLKNLKTNLDMISTEITKTEQLRTMFLSNVSHEIKTPLNGILSATVLLQQKSLDNEVKELVDTIHNSGQYLFTLLNDVLDYYKVMLHQLSLDHINFDLRNELKETFRIFEQKGEEKGIEMHLETEESLPHYLIGDSTRLKQILSNLLDNAIKFTPSKGKVSLNIKPVSVVNGIHEIEFTVSDTGIGIEDKDKNAIWETFSMADMSLTRSNNGTGLGLALSRQLCQLLGGKMYLKTQSGQGSTFIFTVKMEAGIPPEQNNSKQRGILDILLVEDNIINQKLTQKILIDQGFHVDVADNGKMAVKKFKGHRYDLIFMDIQMPVMDGLEATRQIRKFENTKQFQPDERVKIIALTANSQQQDKENCLAAGMDDYINKPFNVKKFPLILSNLQAHHS